MVLICAQSVFCVRSEDDLLWKTAPLDSHTSTRTQPGHYVNAKGSLMPGKFECKIPDICGSVLGAVPSEADKSAEGKGITSSSVFAQNCFQ